MRNLGEKLRWEKFMKPPKSACSAPARRVVPLVPAGRWPRAPSPINPTETFSSSLFTPVWGNLPPKQLLGQPPEPAQAPAAAGAVWPRWRRAGFVPVCDRDPGGERGRGGGHGGTLGWGRGPMPRRRASAGGNPALTPGTGPSPPHPRGRSWLRCLGSGR